MCHNREHDSFDQHEVSLARKVGRMGMLIHRYYEAQAHKRGGFGDPLRGQGRVLALLRAKPETTQRELSYLLDMRQQSLSELLAKLEEKGFVEREKSAEDGRVTIVRLTEAGADAAPSPADMDARADALDCLDEDERAQLETLTNKVCESLESKLEEMGVDPHKGPRPPHRHHHGPYRPDNDDNHHMRRGPYRPHGHGDHGIRQA